MTSRMSGKRVAVLTGNRSDYFLLLPLTKRLHAADDLECLPILSGITGSDEFALRQEDMLRQGFAPAAVIPSVLNDDTPLAQADMLGSLVQTMAHALAELAPDTLVVLGDRLETLAAAQAAFIQHIPVTHLHGGELTQGALDDVFRHCITKLSRWHMVSDPYHAQRVIQLGETPDNVFVIGPACADRLRETPRLTRRQLGLPLQGTLILTVLHPETAQRHIPPAVLAQSLTDALSLYLQYDPGAYILLIEGNQDAGGQAIHAVMTAFADRHRKHVLTFPAMTADYISLLAASDVMVGNSSSAITEAPLLGTASVNIGTRQKGRMRPASVIDSVAEPEAVFAAIRHALTLTASPSLPSQSTADAILSVLRRQLAQGRPASPKIFHDLTGNGA